jgi:hypothetical protein
MVNHAVWPGPKFMFTAPVGGPDADDGLDQRAGMFEEDNEFDPLPCDKPATGAHYFTVMRAQAGLS